jgi:outer membrane receptor protein involved in Fe transport
MAFDGSYIMTVRSQAIAKAAVFRAHLRASEAELAAGLALATAEGLPAVVDALTALQSSLNRAHTLASIAAQRVADAMGDEVEVYSGGSTDDKEPGGNGGGL